MSNAPVFHIDLPKFQQNPYPVLKTMRAKAPIAYVPELGRTLLTKLDDIREAEPNIASFSSAQPEGLMTKLMGENMMRKDGDAHRIERKAIFPTVSPRTVRDHWKAQFEASANTILEDLTPLKTGDLFKLYATRLSGEALRVITGVNIGWQQMDAVSQAMIDGISNYSKAPNIEAACHSATTLIDDAITQALPSPAEYSLISSMKAANLPEVAIRANIKLAISGGQNEPRDVIAGIIWALLNQPNQLELVLTGEVSWMQVFEEYVRWLAPIGMSPRRIAAPVNVGGVDFATGDDVFLMFSSANHDEKYFENPEVFDITRDAGKHIAFGAGPHFCAGAWAAKALIAEVALPMIFERLDLKLGQEPVKVAGWAFRGVTNLPCTWAS